MLSDDQILQALSEHRRGTSVKTLALKYGCRPWCLHKHFAGLTAELIGRQPSVISSAVGVQRHHLAEAIQDLGDLLHYRELGKAPTLLRLGHIIGATNDEATWHRFYELRKTLKRYGLHLGKRFSADEDATKMDAKLVFSVAKVKAFVSRELHHAEAALAEFKDRKGIKGRFRGNGKDKA